MSTTDPRHAVIVGCQRCGTTQLARLLDAHPQIDVAKPLRPEPKWFLDAAASNKSPLEYRRALFGDTRNDVLVEKSTSYFETEAYAERIRCVLPDCSIIVLLRNPVERAISHYCFSIENGLETRPPEIALLGDDIPPTPPGISVSPFRYVQRSEYVVPLRWYCKRFRRVRILITEKVFTDPQELADLYAWLGTDPSFRPENWGDRANRRKLEIPIPPRVRRELETRLLPQIALLEKEFGLDLRCWRATSP
ncbi:MAG: hypothetical protein D6741_09055 [Planctomycetota bacterium]|nr:MAG: hypothetical protein D6741_09055 [Planctomycetota bacterium]